ncbi:hypothetical protein FSP39_007569 [Pinctada imbricata]|uniref:Uncharacterized protein n=1 Tax=Pinctada imbricata TaxID=66713 RepID=A0AA88YQP8_PINIB|nr:hypothetical protein FSP39_007569 [Pinctada imbricata]
MHMASLNFEDTNKLPELSAFDTKRLKMVSGYDLLDRLSRRRQYMKSNVREKTSLSDSFTAVPEMGMVRNLTQFELYDGDTEFQIDGLG